MRRERRGAALATVLLASGVLLVVCMSLATMAVLDLNLAGGYASKSQTLLMAQAAINQLVSELDEVQSHDTSGGAELSHVPRLDLLERYKDRPVFPSRAEDFPGTVQITFDQNDRHYSVDNSDNPDAAAGWLDRGTSGRSVPPYAIDLIIGCTQGSRTNWYEAVLRRRWPYVLATPGHITLMGTPVYQGGGAVTVTPTTVAGNILSFMDIVSGAGGNPQAAATGFGWSMVGGDDKSSSALDNSILVSADLMQSLLQVVPSTLAYVNVGGEADALLPLTSGGTPQSFHLTSVGNVLKGDLDLTANDQTVGVDAWRAPENVDDGGLRRGVALSNLRENLRLAFRLPDVSDFIEVEPQPLDDPSVLPGSSPMPPRTPDDDPEASLKAEGIVPPVSRSGSYFALIHDLKLGPVTPPGGSFTYDATRRFKISGDCGNRYLVQARDNTSTPMGPVSPDGQTSPSPGAGGPYRLTLRSSAAGIELHDCILYVKGNLDLSATVDSDGHAVSLPSLRGTNATVIVDGTLIVNNGSVTGSTDGMVLYCRRLIGQAKGNYRGLIMVEKTAAFFPANPGEHLDIEGGLVVGSEPLSVSGIIVTSTGSRGDDDKWGTKPAGQGPERPGGGPSGGDGAIGPHLQSPIGADDPNNPYGKYTVPGTVSAQRSGYEVKTVGGVGFQGLHLWSTHLKYDPRYLKTLNRFGPMKLMTLRPIE